MTGLSALRRFVRAEPRCELCGASVAGDHEHLVDPLRRGLKCACRACATLLPGRRVPQRSARVCIDAGQWDALGLPVELVFFVRSGGKVSAFYPGPAGAIESLVALDSWKSIGVELEEDVEALLVRRTGSTREHYRVSIDVCYRLAGLLRMHWRGFSGGARAAEEVDRFFARLQAESR